MSGIYHSITELVGKTPLLRLHTLERAHALDAEIVAKLEFFNPNQNVKDRIALQMIEDAEKSGKINKDTTIVEISSGNTGTGVAAIAAAKGYKCRIYIQDSATSERFKLYKAFGAEVETIFTKPVVIQKFAETGGDLVAIMRALVAEIVKEPNVFVLQQMENPANPRAHRAATGPEIWADTQGKLDYFVACVGTGGTISGAGAYLKEQNPRIKVVAIQPGEKSRPTPAAPGPEILGVHAFEGVPESWIPPTLDRSVYDEYLNVEVSEACAAARTAARTEGILVGTSSGAALHAAVQVAKRPESKGKRIVVILPDTGLFYLSTPLFAE
jgi:cysteine synthase A